MDCSAPGRDDPSGPQQDASGPGPEAHEPAERPGDPRYDRVGLLGVGGMGRVYLARDRRLGRMVALKEALDEGLDRRLAREVRVTAGLEHPGIVTVYDEGRDDAGRPFYTMRLMRGRPLSQLLAERRELGERLDLLSHFLAACQALAYAHAQGVVHRDIKPANIMVGAFGETQVVDWGLARRLDGSADETGDASATRPGAILGTPHYMSPEQARGEIVDRRADVWSLGVVLRELLAGARTPERDTPRTGPGRDEARTVELPVETPPELLAIVARATATHPGARYPDAAALATDVAAYLAGGRVRAHRYTALDLALRFLRVWRVPLLVAAAALIVIAVLLVLGNLRLRAQRDRAIAAEAEVRSALAVSDHNLAAALLAQSRVADERHDDAAKEVLAVQALQLADSPEARGLLAGAHASARPIRLATAELPDCQRLLALGVDDILCVDDTSLRREVAGVERWRVELGAAVRELRVEDGLVFVVAHGAQISAHSLATGAVDGAAWEVLDYNVGDAWPLRVAAWHPYGPPTPRLNNTCSDSSLDGISGLLDGHHAVLCADGRVGLAYLTSSPIYTPAFKRDDFVSFTHMQLSPDAQRVVVAGARGRLAAVELATGETWHVPPDRPSPVRQLYMAADGRRIAVVRERGGIELFALPDLHPLGRIAATHVRDLRMFADDSILVAEARRITQWALPAAARPRVLADDHGVAGLAFAPGGDALLTTHGEGRVLLWDRATGVRRHVIDLGDSTIKSGTFLADGERFAVVDAGVGPPGPHAFDVATGALTWRPPPALLSRWYEARSFYFSPGSPLPLMARRVVTLGEDTLVFAPYAPGLLAVDLDTDMNVPIVDCPQFEWIDLAAAPNGERAALVADAGDVYTLSGDASLRCHPIAAPVNATAADITADGELVVSGDRFLARSGPDGLRWQVAHPGPWALDVAFSPDGRWVATAGPDEFARVFASDTGALRAVLSGHTARVSALDFSRDGATLATGSWDGTTRLWDMATLDASVAELGARSETTWGLALADVLGR